MQNGGCDLAARYFTKHEAAAEPLHTATDQPVSLDPDGSESEALPAFLTADEDDEAGASDPEPDAGFEQRHRR